MTDFKELREWMTIQRVWEKGRPVFGRDPEVWRFDVCDNLICRWDYGNRSSEHGWEKDHIDPLGPDELWNLQPLQWYANVLKGARRLGDRRSGQGWPQLSVPCTAPDQPFPILADYFDPPKPTGSVEDPLREAARRLLRIMYGV